VNSSYFYELRLGTAFTRAYKYNEMSHNLINLFKHNSTRHFDRLSTTYPHTVDK